MAKILNNAALRYQRGGIQAQEAAIILNWQAVNKEKGLHTSPEFEMQAAGRSLILDQIQRVKSQIQYKGTDRFSADHTIIEK